MKCETNNRGGSRREREIALVYMWEGVFIQRQVTFWKLGFA